MWDCKICFSFLSYAFVTIPDQKATEAAESTEPPPPTYNEATSNGAAVIDVTMDDGTPAGANGDIADKKTNGEVAKEDEKKDDKEKDKDKEKKDDEYERHVGMLEVVSVYNGLIGLALLN